MRRCAQKDKGRTNGTKTHRFVTGVGEEKREELVDFAFDSWHAWVEEDWLDEAKLLPLVQ
jgi:hypothetical protein